jgi:hypothetical protein
MQQEMSGITQVEYIEPNNLTNPNINITTTITHSVNMHRMCPFRTIQHGIGNRCTTTCMLYNRDLADCNINVIANTIGDVLHEYSK